MPKVDITIRNATGIPLLGVRTQPSPYVIIECQSISYTSPICKFTKNPIWKYHTIVQAKKITSFVNFYIYNNNPNAVDELLAFGKIQFSDLMTRVNSEYKLRLVNSLEQPINSFLWVDHYDMNPKDLYLPMDDKTCIKLRLINQLPKNSSLVCEYGDKSFNLSAQISQNTFRYNPKYDRINCTLKLSRQYENGIKGEILIANIGVNNCIKLRFYEGRNEHNIFMSGCIVLNGLLPQNYNILNVKLLDISKSNGKKNNNYRIKLHGPQNENSFNQKGQCEIYAENSSQILLEYFQQIENYQLLQPYCTFKIPINSLNWSKESLECMHSVKYYDSFRSIETVISMKLWLKKNSQLSNIIPKLNKIEAYFDENSNLSIQHIKIQNCFLAQVIKNAQVQLIHLDLKGFATVFPKFTILENKTQYLIESKQTLREGGLGSFWLVSLDQPLVQKPSANIQDWVIFKLSVQKSNKFEEGKIDFTSKFLSFAKKASVVNICKKFNQMVHDSLLKFTVKSRFQGVVKRGILKIINLKCMGPMGKVETAISVDSTSRLVVGQVGNYLLQKSEWFYVIEGSIRIKVSIQTPEENFTNTSNSKSFSSSLFGNFCEFFGTPTFGKCYTQQIKVSPIHTLQIIFEMRESQKIMELPLTKLSQLAFFDTKNSINFKLKKAFVSVNNQTFLFKVSHGLAIYQTQSYRCNNNKIYFDNSQNCWFPCQNEEQINPIFFSAYSHDEEDKLMIYNGFINKSSLLGRGYYEVVLVYEKQEKRKQIFLIIEVSRNSSFLGGNPSATVNIDKIVPNTTTTIFKTMYKHYLLIKVNGYAYDVYECSVIELALKANIIFNLRKSDYLDLQIYSSYKAISKQLFATTEKELLGSGRITWEQILESGHFILQYYPKKEAQLKYNKNILMVQQKCYKIYVAYTSQKSNLQGRVMPRRYKSSNLQIDVLNRGFIIADLKQFYPLNIDSKITSIEIKPFNLSLCWQSHHQINRTYKLKAQNMEIELQASITIKQNDRYKRFSVLKSVNLRRNHYKTNQPLQITIFFQKYFLITVNFIIYYNKFVAAVEGDYLIREIATRGVKVDKFQLQFFGNLEEQNYESLVTRDKGEAKNCDIAIKSRDLLNNLIFTLEGKGYKVKQKMCLSQINLDQYDHDFVYQRQILIGGQSLILSLIVKYVCKKQNKQEEMSIKYRMPDSKSLSITYPLEHFNRLTLKTKSQMPNKDEGYLLQLTIPSILSINTKQIQLKNQSGDVIKLAPSMSKNEQYLYYSNKRVQVKEIKIINQDYINKSVQPLGCHNGLQKFMIDQDPKLICLINQIKCSVSSIGDQSWTFKFCLHRLMATNNKRLLYLKNTPNDQILTKKLAIVAKHGKQVHFIRGIDEKGFLKDIERNCVQFGYDNSCNILQIFLVIDNYFNESFEDQEKMMQNWIQFLPVSYATINISDIQPTPFGLQLFPLQNNSINLQKSINKMIVRESQIACLCDISFTRKIWGFVSIKLNNCSSIALVEKQKQQMYIYFKLQIEDNNRNCISSITTEARSALLDSLQFTTNQLHFLLIQKNAQNHFNLKLTGFVLNHSSRYILVEKNHDITHILQKRGNHQINIQVKNNETNNLCKNSFQIEIEIMNGTEPPTKPNLIQKAKSINTVDALSFRQLSGIQFFQRLLGCQQLSHFNQCLQQIKQSYIYKQDSQYESFIFIVEYLSFLFDPTLIAQICEIIHLNLLKCPQIIGQLQQLGVNKTMYDYFKQICGRERKKVPSKVMKISSEEYNTDLKQFKEGKTIKQLRNVIQKQSYILYSSEQILGSLSFKNNEAILNIMNLLMKCSKQIRQNFVKDIQQWLQIFGFTTQQSQFQLFLLVLRNNILYGQKLQQKVLNRLIEILVQRRYGLSILFQFWQQIHSPAPQLEIYQSILDKYDKQLQSSSVQTCRGLKMMLNVLLTFKQIDLENLKNMHQILMKKLISNINNSADIIILSSHLDLIAYLQDQKFLSEEMKADVNSLVKEKTATVKDAGAKLIINSYGNRFKTKIGKGIVVGKKEKLDEEMRIKGGFYKKYLITKD